MLNVPVNAFGRAQEAMSELGREPFDRLRTLLATRIATSFPADRSAEINLVPVDRVAAGILAALTAPEAIGARIHLATDNRIRSEEICRIAEEELGVRVRLADPTLSRNVTLPLYKAVLQAAGDQKLANVSVTPSVASSSTYCRMRAFLGSVRMRTKSARVKGSSSTRIGNRPWSSGMRSDGFAT